jgi:ribokinase
VNISRGVREDQVSGKIVVIGSANVDFVMVVENLPRRGESVPSSRFTQLFGGKGANQAVAASRAGGEVAFVGCVGDDVFGGLMKDNLAAAGVNVDHVCEQAGVASGAALIMVDQIGGNILSVAPGANGRLTPEVVRPLSSLIANAAMVILQNEIPLETTHAAVDIASEFGAPVLLNLAPAGPFDPKRLRKLTYLVVNETEAEAVSGLPVESEAQARAAAAWMRDQGVGTAIITLGAQGAYIDGPAYCGVVPSFPVSAVDTTAAGDTFCGALATALAEGSSLELAARFASAAAALCVTRLGAQASIPARGEIEALLAA